CSGSAGGILTPISSLDLNALGNLPAAKSVDAEQSALENGLTLMVPFLAAYIGYSIAERSALAPCAIGAWVGNSFGAGFFGAL
ncbi:PTS fructose-like transporter subunit EIIC, partial [Escherichia coli]|nr:PTS fructose-like transporter subunit EIIC [Escherichia coli]